MNVWCWHGLFDYVRLEIAIWCPNRDMNAVTYILLYLKGKIRAKDKNTDIISIEKMFKAMEQDRKSFSKIAWKHTQFSSVQLLSRVRLFATPWIAECQASLFITISWSSLRLTSIQPSHPLSSPSPPALNPSQRHFQWVNSSHEVAKIRSFSFSIVPSKEHSGLISFRMDLLNLLAVQGTLKSLLQHHSSKASILWCSAFFTVQLSQPYMTTGKTIALTRWTFVGKVIVNHKSVFCLLWICLKTFHSKWNHIIYDIWWLISFT